MAGRAIRALAAAGALLIGASACSSGANHTAAPASSPRPVGTAAARPTPTVPPTTAKARPTLASSAPTRGRPSTAAPTSISTSPSPAAHADRLPVSLPTGSARQVITVVAASTASTTASLRAWRRSGSGWLPYGPVVPAFLGSDGSTSHPSEQLSATPLGSFTLTRAFGHDADPGTALPYTRTTPADWWISQAGPLYNTMQRCTGDCPFTQGDPNEHLYYETPAYDWAVVIDYNTANSPTGVRQNAGSAFFLHVSEGRPTAGCVSIPAAQLVRIMRWLEPSDHPRILIGA